MLQLIMIIGVFVLFAALGVYVRDQTRRGLVNAVSQLVDAEGIEEGSVTVGFFSRLPQLSGKFRGRRFSVDYSMSENGDPTLILAIASPQAFSLVVEPMTWATRFLTELGVKSDHKVGDAAFDAAFRVDTRGDRSDGAAAQFVGERQVQASVEALFALPGITEARFHAGQLVVTQKRKRLDPLIHIPALLDAASDLTSGLIRVRLALPAARTELSDVRCPYCRNGILDEHGDSRLVACVQCGTIHHRDCWNAASACSVFACRSVRNEAVADA